MAKQDILESALKNGKINRSQFEKFAKCKAEYHSEHSTTYAFETTEKHPAKEINFPFQNAVLRVISTPPTGIVKKFTHRYLVTVY